MGHVRLSCGVFLCGILLPAQARAERWKLQYFYDRDRETFAINDLKCPTARRCVATGAIESEKGSGRGMAAVTSDGGAHWGIVPLKEAPLSLFLLDDSNGWIVGARNLWKTIEGGRSWEKAGKLPAGTLRVAFLDAKHGFAVGTKKSVMETTDGGLEWKPVAAAAEPKTREEYTAYTWIDFVDARNGIITGFSRPPRRDSSGLPDWVNPEKAVERRQWPSVSITLDTHDAGKSWTASTGSFFGQIARVRLSASGAGLGLISFTDNFDWPAEVFRIDWKSGRSARVYRDRNRRITDMAVLSEKLAYLAGQEVPGKLQQSPIPGRLKMYKSVDLQSWTEMEVDYRATAAVAVLSAADESNIWVATDTGMILRLEP
jgi:photosynthesis system II assembly factor YCF48-like protein